MNNNAVHIRCRSLSFVDVNVVHSWFVRLRSADAELWRDAFALLCGLRLGAKWSCGLCRAVAREVRAGESG
jgi:hypothetical protein